MQVELATEATDYHRSVMAAQNVTDDIVGELNPAIFAAAAVDGRPLDSLLFRPVVTVKNLIGAGTPVPQAMNQGRLQFAMLAAQQVRDAGRVADGVVTLADQSASGYVRMLTLPSCARCVVLAGKRFRVNDGFRRHPWCDCVHVPYAEAAGVEDLRTDPTSAVESGQVRLTQAERKALEDGADLNQVVNAQRGMYEAGGRRFTTESTTRRGVFGGYEVQPDGSFRRRPTNQTQKLPGNRYRTAKVARPTPEQLYRDARDRDEAVQFLRRFGYLL